MESLEKSAAHLVSLRVDLMHLCKALMEAGTPHEHDVSQELERLDELSAWFMATIYETWWTGLIADGKLAPPSEQQFTSGSALGAVLGQ